MGGLIDGENVSMELMNGWMMILMIMLMMISVKMLILGVSLTTMCNLLNRSILMKMYSPLLKPSSSAVNKIFLTSSFDAQIRITARLIIILLNYSKNSNVNKNIISLLIVVINCTYRYILKNIRL